MSRTWDQSKGEAKLQAYESTFWDADLFSEDFGSLLNAQKCVYFESFAECIGQFMVPNGDAAFERIVQSHVLQVCRAKYNVPVVVPSYFGVHKFLGKTKNSTA